MKYPVVVEHPRQFQIQTTHSSSITLRKVKLSHSQAHCPQKCHSQPFSIIRIRHSPKPLCPNTLSIIMGAHLLLFWCPLISRPLPLRAIPITWVINNKRPLRLITICIIIITIIMEWSLLVNRPLLSSSSSIIITIITNTRLWIFPRRIFSKHCLPIWVSQTPLWI